ncbi:MAG: Na/Pi cotransporter family protein [Planctomycetes bacterium]|nr:Na/Pi cotransporter family protein [Planctomycetota bacterium]
MEIDWFKMAYTLLGGLGIFFLGMKNMSESLQILAGSLIKKIINALTTNRILAVLVGTFVTTLVQSSSVTTVMVIGFVNAGLMELTQAIGVILGANIGTTITGWILAIKIGKYGLLLVAIGAFPLIFAKRTRVRSIGNLFVALGFVFMGLEFMSGAFKPLRGHEGFISLMHYFDAQSYFSVLACIAVGMLLTFIIQSSSAMLGITISLAITGAIEFQTAVALVLGENIGTTITALLASIGTNATAKRAARAHAAFNVFGVLWISLIFAYYIQFVDWVIPQDASATKINEAGETTWPFIAAHIAAAHTLFNVTNTLMFIPLVGFLAKFVTRITPDKTQQGSHLVMLGDTTGPAELAMLAAEKELVKLANLTGELLTQSQALVNSEKPSNKDLDAIADMENRTDVLQTEITLYVCQLQENRLTHEESASAYSLIRASDELESIADYGFAIARYRMNMYDRDSKFSEDAAKELAEFFGLVVGLFQEVEQHMQRHETQDLAELKRESERMRAEANKIRKRHRSRLESGACSPSSGLFFSDMIVSLRKMRGHVINLAEALNKVEISDQ